jgi:hypothetical protein
VGFSISWTAFKGLQKADVLTRTGFRDTAILDEANESPFSIAELPTGWTVLFSNDFDYGSAEHLTAPSNGVTVVACQVEEHVGFSAAHCYEDSRELWSVWHDSQHGIRDLSTRGALPPEFAAIRDRLSARQDQGEGMWARKPDPSDPFIVMLQQAGTKIVLGEDRWMPTDFIFDVPVELAASLTGYRHDRAKFDWGQPRFTRLERTG